MGEFEEGLRVLAALQRRREEQGELGARELVTRAELEGTSLVPGERVRDSVTGEEATVVGSQFVHVTIAPSEREGS